MSFNLNLNQVYYQITMSTMSYTVKDIYALREANRNTIIPSVISKSIESVQKSIEKSGNPVSFKHLDWRNPKAKQEAYHPPFTNQKKKVYGAEDAERQAPQKYVSKFKKASENIDDTILNTILRGKLNKFSTSNYMEIKEFITHIIDGGQTDMIKCFMKLVFEKAASEEIFCPLYAKLISELSVQYPILHAEMSNLYTEYISIFNNVSDGQSEDYDGLCQRNIEKKYRRGYSQFLAELIKHNVVHVDFLIQIINKIVMKVEEIYAHADSIKVIEEYADCLMKIIKAIQQQQISNAGIQTLRAYLKDSKMAQLKLLSERDPTLLGMSNKSRFTFLDIYEAIHR